VTPDEDDLPDDEDEADDSLIDDDAASEKNKKGLAKEVRLFIMLFTFRI
jgi:hypothetical protein